MLFLRLYFWVAPHILLGFVFYSFLRQGLQSRRPFFLGYLVFEIAEFLTLLTLNFLPAISRAQYSRVYVFGLVVSTILRFGVVYELSAELLLSNAALTTTLRPLMQWVAALVLLATAFASATLSNSQVQRVEGIFHALELLSSATLVGLLFVLFVFARAFRIAWRSCAAGIALGFGVFAAVELATTALRTNSGDSGNIVIDLLQMGAYHVCVLVWFVYIVLGRRNRAFTGTGLRKNDLEAWDQELQRMVQR
jgi:hypothetical protein